MPTKYPPALDFSEAVKAVKEIYAIHKTQGFNMKLLVEPLNTTPTSSYFVRRISALQTYGLLEKVGDVVNLTPLAEKIANPIGGEDGEAKITSFRKIDVLSDLLNRHPNGKLSPSDTLKRILIDSVNVDRNTVNQWYDFVVNSFREIAGMGSAETRRIIAPLQEQASTPVLNPSGEPVIPYSVGKDNFQNIELPSGKKFQFSLPTDSTSLDLSFIIGFLELKKKSMEEK